MREPGWWLVPRLSVNAAAYRDAGNRASRVIPTLSVDAGFELERSTQAFGRAVQQTLEPRVLYVRTPYRAQSNLPNYDAAAKDFNFASIYTDNQFSGIDRVSDAHQLTAGVTTRFVDAITGAEALRLGLVQRYLFRSQRVTPKADGSPDGAPLEQSFSDALLLGSTSVFPAWTLDAAVQYSPDIHRSVRSILGARYSPGPLRTLSATYRLARGLSEQLEMGWQWPVFSTAAAVADLSAVRANASRAAGSAAGGGGSCTGTWYAVGRVNYSLKDSRITDSVLGAEYDAGCWIGRFVAERLSTGRSEATTRLMLQLELVGLSRIGSNPLKVLKDNIPGYRLLREERRGASPADDPASAPVYD
jgi:LPS-assembly protein